MSVGDEDVKDEQHMNNNTADNTESVTGVPQPHETHSPPEIQAEIAPEDHDMGLQEDGPKQPLTAEVAAQSAFLELYQRADRVRRVGDTAQ